MLSVYQLNFNIHSGTRHSDMDSKHQTTESSSRDGRYRTLPHTVERAVGSNPDALPTLNMRTEPDGSKICVLAQRTKCMPGANPFLESQKTPLHFLGLDRSWTCSPATELPLDPSAAAAAQAGQKQLPSATERAEAHRAGHEADLHFPRPSFLLPFPFHCWLSPQTLGSHKILCSKMLFITFYQQHQNELKPSSTFLQLFSSLFIST